jgi:hypothetical protein
LRRVIARRSLAAINSSHPASSMASRETSRNAICDEGL